jgi:signal transduction histidine kinase
MNGILGTIQLVLDTKLSMEQLDYVLTMKHSADSLLSLINDILLFSKLEANQFTLHSTVFRAEHLLEGVGGLLSSLVSEKQLSLYFLLEEDLPYHLIGDVDRLQQILVNMIGNSLKFTNPSGEVIVTCSRTCSTCYIRSIFGTNENSPFVMGGSMYCPLIFHFCSFTCVEGGKGEG